MYIIIQIVNNKIILNIKNIVNMWLPNQADLSVYSDTDYQFEEKFIDQFFNTQKNKKNITTKQLTVCSESFSDFHLEENCVGLIEFLVFIIKFKQISRIWIELKNTG